MGQPRTSEEIIAEADATLQHTLRLQQQFVWLQVELERTRTRLERTRRNIAQTRRELLSTKRKVVSVDSTLSGIQNERRPLSTTNGMRTRKNNIA